jgi:hypothetical protein
MPDQVRHDDGECLQMCKEIPAGEFLTAAFQSFLRKQESGRMTHAWECGSINLWGILSDPDAAAS